MTYSYYLRWREAVQKLILKQMERLNPRAGQNVSVFGSDIAIHLGNQADEEPAPTWQYVVYGTVLTNGSGDLYGPAFAAILQRGSSIANDFPFVAATQVQTLVPLPPTTKTVTYYLTTLTPEQIEASQIDEGIFRGGLRLTASLFTDQDGNSPSVRDFTLVVGRTGASVTIQAPTPETPYYLRITAAERL